MKEIFGIRHRLTNGSRTNLISSSSSITVYRKRSGPLVSLLASSPLPSRRLVLAFNTAEAAEYKQYYSDRWLRDVCTVHQPIHGYSRLHVIPCERECAYFRAVYSIAEGGGSKCLGTLPTRVGIFRNDKLLLARGGWARSPLGIRREELIWQLVRVL